MTAIRATLAALAVTGLLAGCSGVPVQLGSPSNMSTTQASGNARTINAEACGFQLLLFIPIKINDRLARAYEGLQSQAGSAVISDVEVKESWSYGFVGTTHCTALQAKATPL